MNQTNTGIAVAVAVAVIAVIFLFPSLSPFNSAPAAVATAPDTTTTITDTTTNQDQTTTTMPDTNPTTLQITDEVVGTGALAQSGTTVTVNYVGSLTDGTVFDASANHGTTGFTFALGAGQVISGWDQGIVGMKVGGKRKLVIPAALAYGSRAIGDVIPANSTLVFEVELLAVTPAK